MSKKAGDLGEPAGAGAHGPDDGEESKKSSQTILQQEIAAGRHELERPAPGLALSALSAGLDVGFSVLLLTAVLTLADGAVPQPWLRLLTANAYAVGFVFVVFGRSELFTEHTTLAVLPVLDGQASPLQLGRLWGIVYAANQVGVSLFAAALVWVGPGLGLVDEAVFGELARRVVRPPAALLFASAVLAGWLMGLVSWLVTAGRDTVSQVFFVWLVTATIGFAELHHCVVGAGEVLTGVLSGQASWADHARFLALATAGNAVGGTVFVALIKYAHARPAGQTEPPPRRRKA